MKAQTCCSMAASSSRHEAADGKAHPPRVGQRRFAWAKCSLPTLILALLPKCPACLAAYVALGTGISLSMAAASALRTLLIVACVATLAWLFVSLLRPAWRERILGAFSKEAVAADLRKMSADGEIFTAEARRRGEKPLGKEATSVMSLK